MNLQIQPLYQRTGNVGLRLKKYPDQLKKHFGVSLKVKRRNLSGINLKNAVSNPVSLLWAPQAPLQGNTVPPRGSWIGRRTSGLKIRSSHPVLHSKLHQSTKSVQSQPLLFHQVPRWLRVTWKSGALLQSLTALQSAYCHMGLTDVVGCGRR